MDLATKLMTKAAWHARSAPEVVEEFQSDVVHGLSSLDAAKRLIDHGPNALGSTKQRSAFRILIHQFYSLIVVLLVLATGVTLAIGDKIEAEAVLFVVVLNAFIGFITEWKAAALAAGQSPSSLLFGYGRTGMPRTRATMWEIVRKLCALAGVPPVCTHSLRGLYATLAVHSGSASHVVASSLGHGSFEVTQRHYAQASSVANASTARVLSILDSPLQGEEQAVALATDLCARLERPLLLRLAQLLSQSYESLEAKKLHCAIDPQSIREPKIKDSQRRELELKLSMATRY
jgi:hypothetical protein